jgi:tetratricopeptide (TPR) repeat protein
VDEDAAFLLGRGHHLRILPAMSRPVPLALALLLALFLTLPCLAVDPKKNPADDIKAPSAELNLASPKDGRLPDFTTGLSDEAARAFGRKEWDKARKAYLEMLHSDPNNALTYANLGAVEQQAGNAKDAKLYYMHAVELNPRLQQTWLALGLLCHREGDEYLALSSLSRAVHEDPTDPKAHNYLAVVARSLGWQDAAEAELQRAIELKPDYANAHFNLALMYLDRSPPATELARRHYEKAIALGADKDEIVEAKLKEK